MAREPREDLEAIVRDLDRAQLLDALGNFVLELLQLIVVVLDLIRHRGYY